MRQAFPPPSGRSALARVRVAPPGRLLVAEENDMVVFLIDFWRSRNRLIGFAGTPPHAHPRAGRGMTHRGGFAAQCAASGADIIGRILDALPAVALRAQLQLALRADIPLFFHSAEVGTRHADKKIFFPGG